MQKSLRQRTISVLASLALLLTLFAGLPASVSAAPSTITINTDADWQNFVDDINSGINHAGDIIDLQTDIQGVQVPVGAFAAAFGYATTGSPIVTGGTGFAGTLNGNGHSIDISMSDYYSSLGLFAYLEPGGVINDLTVTGSIESDSSDTFVIGGLVGYNCGTIDGVTNEVAISASAHSDYVGGIAGFNDNYYTVGAPGVIRNSQNNGSVAGVTRVGGIAGQNAGLIASCVNTGAISSDSDVKSGVGGIAGRNGNAGTAIETGVIRDCYNTGTVSATNGSWVGGLTGFQNSRSSCNNTYNVGELSGFEDKFVDNTTGHNENLNAAGVQNCYAPSDIDLGAEWADGTINTYTSAQMQTPAFASVLNGSPSSGHWTQSGGNYPALLFNDTSSTTPATGGGSGATVYLDGTRGSGGDGAVNNPFGNIADAVDAAGAGGVVYIVGTVTFAANTTRNDSVNFARGSGFTGTMFVVNPGAGVFVTLTSASIDGGNVGTIFDVQSGRLRLRGNIGLTNAAIGVLIEDAGTLEVNRTIIDDCTYSIQTVTANSTFIYNDFGGTLIESPVYLATGSYISVAATVADKGPITVQSQEDDEGVLIAQVLSPYTAFTADDLAAFVYDGDWNLDLNGTTQIVTIY